MKRYVKASSSEYIPNITSEDVDDIIEQLVVEVMLKYSKRYNTLQVDVDDVSLHNNRVKALVTLYNNGKVIAESWFDFAAYDEYFDMIDFRSHLLRKMKEFANYLIG